MTSRLFEFRYLSYCIISDPKLKNVNFECLVNGHKIEPINLTSTHMKKMFGHHEYSIVGEFDTSIDTNEIQIIMKGEDASGLFERNISLEPCDNGPIGKSIF